MDRPRGVWDEEDDGDAAGEEYSIEGLVTRFGPDVVVALNADLDVSSSDVAPISTSFNKD
jgi:hypothetical protein